MHVCQIGHNRLRKSSMKLKRLVRAIAIVAPWLFGTSSVSHGGESVDAVYCVSIQIPLEQTELVVREFDNFANRMNLSFETGDPGGRYYFSQDKRALIALRNGMAEFGSILSYVNLEEDVPQDLLKELQEFVSDRIETKYQAVNCESIDGFSMPRLYR